MKCDVKVRYYGGAYLAASGRGRRRVTASCTRGAEAAVRRCAAKAFRLDACNTQTEDDIILTRTGEDEFHATLPAGQIF